MCTLKKLLKEYRYYTILIPVLVFLFRVWALPPRVDAVEEKSEGNENAVEKLAQTVEISIKVNEEYKKGQEEYKKGQQELHKQHIENIKMLTKLYIQKGIRDE